MRQNNHEPPDVQVLKTPLHQLNLQLHLTTAKLCNKASHCGEFRILRLQKVDVYMLVSKRKITVPILKWVRINLNWWILSLWCKSCRKDKIKEGGGVIVWQMPWSNNHGWERLCYMYAFVFFFHGLFRVDPFLRSTVRELHSETLVREHCWCPPSKLHVLNLWQFITLKFWFFSFSSFHNHIKNESKREQAIEQTLPLNKCICSKLH